MLIAVVGFTSDTGIALLSLTISSKRLCNLIAMQNGFTPLHLAAQEGHSEMVALLLEHAANVNAHAKNGLTPMHLAAQEDGVPTAEILVQYHADIDPQTKVSVAFGKKLVFFTILKNLGLIGLADWLSATAFSQTIEQFETGIKQSPVHVEFGRAV